MNGHKVLKTAAIPIVLMIIGLKHYTQNLAISIAAGIGIYFIAYNSLSSPEMVLSKLQAYCL